MLPRSARLSSSTDIQHVIKTGKSLAQPSLKLKYLPSSPDKPSRICIIASKKYFHDAVDRNRIRRRLAPIIVPHLTNGFDHVLFVYSQTTQIPPSQLQQAIDTLFSKI